jgi:hypothetical protein
MKTATLSSLLLVSALAGSQPGQAQAMISDKAPGPGRFYGGAQKFQSRYEMFYPTRPSLVIIQPWQLVAGMYLLPRLAIQVGYAHSGDEYHADPSYTGTTITGKPTYGRRGSESYEQVIPLLLRYSLIRTPHPRLQIDLLGGGALVSSGFRNYAADFVDGVLVSEVDDQAHATQLYATLGLGARYPFGRHFEGVFDYSYSRNLRSVPEAAHLYASGSKWGLTRAYSLGLHYRFNVKKKAAAPGAP